MGISVIICCYNSSTRLPETLSHLAAQKSIDDVAWEVIIVDNGSDDATVTVAKQIWASLGVRQELRTVSEPERGVHHARATGIKHAMHDCIIFCDDDNWLADNYFFTAFDILNRMPGVGVVGGRGVPVFEKEAPPWFKQYEAVFACGRQWSREGVLDWSAVGLYSAGMVIRKSLVMNVLASGYQSEFSARSDKKLSGGEDFELVVLIRAMGYKAYYADSLVFKHYMPASRMTWDYLKKIVRGSTINTAKAYVYADMLRLLYTGNKRYEVSWIKDLAKAVYGAFLIKVRYIRDFQIIWIKLVGSVSSVIKNIPHYPLLKKKIEAIYESAHKTD